MKHSTMVDAEHLNVPLFAPSCKFSVLLAGVVVMRDYGENQGREDERNGSERTDREKVDCLEGGGDECWYLSRVLYPLVDVDLGEA